MGVKIRFGAVVRAGLVELAALLVRSEPRAASHLVAVLHTHAHNCTGAGEAADHHDNKRATAQARRIRDNGLLASHLQETAERVAAAFIAENRQVLTRQPALAQAHYNLALFLKPDSSLEARQELRALVRQRAEDAEAHYDLGLLLDEQHRTDAALREYRETLRLNPRHQWAHYDFGYAMKEKGDLPAAQREFQAALRLQPGYPEAHYGLGEVYYMQHRLDLAAAEYRQATQRITPFPEAYQRLCSVLAERGRLPEAIAAGREAARLAPNSGEAHDALAYAYGMSHQAAACACETRAAIQLNPVDALAPEDLGDALIELSRRAETRAEWQRVLQLENGRNAQEAREMLAKCP